MGKELELKFCATKALLEQLQSAVEGAQTVYQMQTSYYDTPEGELSERRCTLRCRIENGYPICTFKTPVNDTERGEFDVSGVTIEAAIAPLARLSGVQELSELGKRIVCVCGARFQRIAIDVTSDGFTAELALDQGVLLGGGREIPLCEAELEYKSGNEEKFLEYATAFTCRYGLEIEKRSKFVRAYALAKGE